MKKETAVEWLQGQFRAFGTISDSNDERTHQLIKTAINMCEQAKAMEREQIVKAWEYGCMTNYGDAQTYYNEIYKGGKQ